MSTDAVGREYLKETNMMFIGGLMVAIGVEHSNLHRRIALKVSPDNDTVACNSEGTNIRLDINFSLFVSGWQPTIDLLYFAMCICPNGILVKPC